MNLAYIGNFRPSFSTENHMRLALIELGHEVTTYQEDESAFDALLVERYDMVLWTRTWFGDADAQRSMLSKAAQAQIPTVAVHLDRYWDLEREHQIRDEPWWRCSMVFSADGGSAERFTAAGINHFWLPPGIHGAECYPGRPRPAYRSGVAFVGSWQHYHPEWPYRLQLIEHLKARWGRNFRAWPRGRAVRERELNDLYASARVVVGDSLNVGPAGPFTATHYWSDRVYETLGRGGFLIHPFVEGLETEFVDGEHLRFYRYGDFEELDHLIGYYLEHDEERRAIATAGQQHVKERYTYTHRMQQMLAMVETLGVQKTERRLQAAREHITVRPDSTDPDVIGEVFEENVYQLKPEHLEGGGWVVDLGANIGAFSLYAAALDPNVQVLAVEPQPDNAERLSKHIAAAGMFDRVRPVLCAAGAKSGSGFIVGKHGGAFTAATADETKPSVAVPVTSLWELLYTNGIDRVRVLKLDIEGAEYDVLAGCPPELFELIDYICMEFHGSPMVERGVEPGSLGRVCELLSETHHVTTLGAASRGGMLYARRY